MPSKYTPRLSIELTDEQNEALTKIIPWGIKKYLFQLLVEAMVEAVADSGNEVLAAILRRQVKVRLEPKDGAK